MFASPEYDTQLVVSREASDQDARVPGESDAVSGVNATIGRPIIRTSVDHGTNFDIADERFGSEQRIVVRCRPLSESHGRDSISVASG